MLYKKISTECILRRIQPNTEFFNSVAFIIKMQRDLNDIFLLFNTLCLPA